MSVPKTYMRPMSGWWRKNPYFTRYMIREGTSVFVGIYALILLFGLGALADGPEAYQSWLGFVSNPLVVILHLVILAAALYSMYTWFKVSPKAAPPVFIGTEKVPDVVIVGSQYVGAIVLSLALLYLAWSG